MRLFKKKKQLPFFQRPHFAKRILEVGPGHNPYVGITHAVDKYPDDNTQRGGDLVVRDGVELHIGDIESLPFKDDERFDFIYASHILEHLPEPQRAINELNRLAHRGYIETPSPLREQLTYEHYDFHLSFVWATPGGNIHLIMKNEETLGSFCNCENGRLAKELYTLKQNTRENIEQLLPRGSKYTFYPYRGTLKLHEYSSFQQACDAGCCAYASTSVVRARNRFPAYLVQPKSRKLHRILKQVAPSL